MKAGWTGAVAFLRVDTSDLKMLREDLCVIMTNAYNIPGRNPASLMRRLQNLCNEIDRHRPLGSDGKHGNLHTSTCGCEDK